MSQVRANLSHRRSKGAARPRVSWTIYTSSCCERTPALHPPRPQTPTQTDIGHGPRTPIWTADASDRRHSSALGHTLTLERRARWVSAGWVLGGCLPVGWVSAGWVLLSDNRVLPLAGMSITLSLLPPAPQGRAGAAIRRFRGGGVLSGSPKKSAHDSGWGRRWSLQALQSRLRLARRGRASLTRSHVGTLPIHDDSLPDAAGPWSPFSSEVRPIIDVLSPSVPRGLFELTFHF